MNAILLASAGVVILLVGGGVGFWLGRSGVGGSKARVDKAEADLEEYKRSVTEHFGQTASHFQAIGKQYRELYEHMATGAQSLCEPNDEGAQLLFAPGAETASTSAEQPAAEETELRSPIDYAEEPVETEVLDVAEAESAVTDTAEDSVSESTSESQPETKTDAGERTIH